MNAKFVNRWLFLGLPAFGLASCESSTAPQNSGKTEEAVVTAVSVQPSRVALLLGETKEFTAQVEGRGDFNKEVRWQSTLGTITSTGLYTSPTDLDESATALIRAVSVADSSQFGTADAIIFVPARVDSVVLTPSRASLLTGESFQFTANVFGKGHDPGAPAVRWFVNDVEGGDSLVGIIRPLNLNEAVYTAPNRACLNEPLGFTVNAVALADTTKSGKADLSVFEPPISLPKLCWMRLHRPMSVFPVEVLNGVALDAGDNIIAGGSACIGQTGTSGCQASTFRGVLLSYTKDGLLQWSAELNQVEIISQINGLTDGRRFLFSAGTSCGQVATTGGAIALTTVAGSILDMNMRDDVAHLAVSQGDDIGRIFTVDENCGVLNSVIVEAASLPTARPLNSLASREDHYIAAFSLNYPGGNWNHSSFILKVNLQGQLIWERRYISLSQPLVVESDDGAIYVAGRLLPPSGSSTFEWLIVRLDQDGNELWRAVWDGDNSRNAKGPVNLISDPRGGVVAVGGFSETETNASCIDPLGGGLNCTDFGAWAVDAAGGTRWKIRRDFGSSPLELVGGAAFDTRGDVIMVGLLSGPERREGGVYVRDYLDAVAMKWRVP